MYMRGFGELSTRSVDLGEFQRLGEVVGHDEDFVEAGDLEDAPDLRVELAQDQAAVDLDQALAEAQEPGELVGVEVADVGEGHHHGRGGGGVEDGEGVQV